MACFNIHSIAVAAAAVAILLLIAPHVASAITCGDMTFAVAPCMAYALSGQGSPSAGCCNGVKSLNLKAATGADHQVACNCLKNLVKSVNAGAVVGISSKCGVKCDIRAHEF